MLLDIYNKYNEHEYKKVINNDELWKELIYVLNTIENYNFIISGKDINKNNNTTYHILKCVNTKKIEEAMIFFILYIIYSNYEKGYIGIDFEYNNFNEIKKKDKTFKHKYGRETCLVQLCCDIKIFKKSYIILIDPEEIKKNQLYYKIFSKLLCCNANKILHGGDGLDIPYLYHNFFKTKKEILKFTETVYDTKFLCDYLNILRDIDKKTRCNIYSFLYNENIMSKEILEDLLNNEKKMGPIIYLYTDIKTMDDNFTKYSIYDVIYLKELLEKVLDYNTQDIDKVIQMTRLVLLVRQNIIKLETGSNQYVDNIVGQIEYFKKIYKQMISSKKNIPLLKELKLNCLTNLVKN